MRTIDKLRASWAEAERQRRWGIEVQTDTGWVNEFSLVELPIAIRIVVREARENPTRTYRVVDKHGGTVVVPPDAVGPDLQELI